MFRKPAASVYLVGQRKRGIGRTRKTTRVSPPPHEAVETFGVQRGAGAEDELVAGPDLKRRSLAGAREVRLRAQMDVVSIGEQEQQQQADGEAAQQCGPEPRPAGAHEVPHDPHAHESQEGRAAARAEQAVPDDGHQADGDPDQVRQAQAIAAAREQEQQGARQAELVGLPDVAVVSAEPAVGAAIHGVEPARMDDLVNPGDQAQGRERDADPNQADTARARERDGRRMGVRGRAVRAPPHAATEAQNSQERDRLGVVELSLAKIAAELVRLGDLEIKRQESVQEDTPWRPDRSWDAACRA